MDQNRDYLYSYSGRKYDHGKRYNTLSVESGYQSCRHGREFSLALPSLHDKGRVKNNSQKQYQFFTHEEEPELSPQMKQCEHILDNLRKLTNASYKKNMRKGNGKRNPLNKRSHQNDSYCRNSSEAQREILYIAIPEVIKKNQKKKSKVSHRGQPRPNHCSASMMKEQLYFNKQYSMMNTSGKQRKYNMSKIEALKRNKGGQISQTIDIQIDAEDRSQDKERIESMNHSSIQLIESVPVNHIKDKTLSKKKALLKYLAQSRNQASVLSSKVSAFIKRKSLKYSQTKILKTGDEGYG